MSPDGMTIYAVGLLARSPGMAGWMENKGDEAKVFLGSVPIGRVGNCEQDIGHFVAVLCSDASPILMARVLQSTVARHLWAGLMARVL